MRAVQASIPKQYLELMGQPIATYSMQTFAGMTQVKEIVVVCEPEWRCVAGRFIVVEGTTEYVESGTVVGGREFSISFWGPYSSQAWQ